MDVAPRQSSAAEGPQFIAVGPEKTGTTWIHANLDAHPGVRLPPVKELRYFWEKHFYPTGTLLQRLGGKQRWHRQQFWRVAGLMFALALGSPIRSALDSHKVAWYYRYLMREHDDDWYRECFSHEPGSISGEISPQYFFLRPEEVFSVAPGAKIIISLRKPVDWVWSFARMNDRGGYLDSRFGSLEGFVDYQVAERSFSRSLGKWQAQFRRNNYWSCSMTTWWRIPGLITRASAPFWILSRWRCAKNW